MKNTLQINVGLTTSNNNPVGIHLLLQDLRAAGLYTVNSRIALGYWQGAPECTLAAECLFAIPLCHPESKIAVRASLARIAAQHDQTCIAVLWPDSTGELVPDVGSFDPNQFRPVYPLETAPAPAPAPAPTREFATWREFLIARSDNPGAVVIPCAEPPRAPIAPAPEITSGW